MSNDVSRRRFLQVAGTGLLSIGSLSVVEAALLPKGQRSEKFDVVVIGTGLSGMVAAHQAITDGASVAIVEKLPADKAGGNSALAGGLIAIPGEDSPKAKDEYFEDFMKKSAGRANPDLTRLLADQVLDGVQFLKDLGAEFTQPIPVAPYRVKGVVFVPGLFRGIRQALETLRSAFERKGGKIFFGTKAKQLIMDERGRVVGVRAVGKDGVTDYLGEAVVIATGGYAANREYLEKYVDPEADAMMVRGVTWATGDGHALAQEVGAALLNMGGITSLHIAAVSPKNTSSGNPGLTVPLCVGINKEGKRYVDESKGYVANGKAAMKQPGQTIALVFDEEIKKQSIVAATVKQFQDLNLEVVEADTLQELAGKIGVPADQLVKTITDFNDAVQDGKAPNASPPKMTSAFKVATPKFYAFYPLVPGITLTFGGIKINAKAQVLELDGAVIPGLYAAGEGAGDLFYDDYVGGGSLANCLTIGRIAGKSAAAEKGAK